MLHRGGTPIVYASLLVSHFACRVSATQLTMCLPHNLPRVYFSQVFRTLLSSLFFMGFWKKLLALGSLVGFCFTMKTDKKIVRLCWFPLHGQQVKF